LSCQIAVNATYILAGAHYDGGAGGYYQPATAAWPTPQMCLVQPAFAYQETTPAVATKNHEMGDKGLADEIVSLI
jgi:hypothetical protein